MAMFQKKDVAHLKAMDEMRELMQQPEALTEWFESKKKEFEALPKSWCASGGAARTLSFDDVLDQ